MSFHPTLRLVVVLLLLFSGCKISGQQISEEERLYLLEYNERIQLSELDGVYIPKSLEDAIDQLIELSDPEGLQRFMLATEDQISLKLKGGLQRWILINWGFERGSRLSHALKAIGIHHPEDMAQFLVVCLHRHLNQRPLRIEEQVENYQAARLEVYRSRMTIIDTIEQSKSN